MKLMFPGYTVMVIMVIFGEANLQSESAIDKVVNKFDLLKRQSTLPISAEVCMNKTGVSSKCHMISTSFFKILEKCTGMDKIAIK